MIASSRHSTPAARTMLRSLAVLSALAVLALTGAACGSASDGAGAASGATPAGDAHGASKASATSSAPSSSSSSGGARTKGVRFAECMRTHGVDDFPDPDASGELTVDAVANGASIETSGPAWTQALGACKDLEPAGFTGHTRTAAQQRGALAFAQCVRDHGIADFPDPGPDDALVDTTRVPSATGRGALEIPGFQQALDACGSYAGQAGVTGP